VREDGLFVAIGRQETSTGLSSVKGKRRCAGARAVTFFTFNFARPVRAPWSVFVSRSKMKSALLASQDHMEDHNGHTAVSGARESKERMSIPKVPSSDRRWLRPERGPRLTCKHDGLGERRSSIPGAFKTFSVDHTKSRGRSPLCNRYATSVMCFLSLAVSAGRCC